VVKEEPDSPSRKRPVTRSNAGISVREPAAQQPRGQVLRRIKEEAGDEPVLLAAAWRQQQLRAVEYNEDIPGYLKTLLDSMNDHRAWEAPLCIVIEHSVRECNLFINLISGEGSSSGAGPSEVKEEPEKEDEETQLARKYTCFICSNVL
jgi:hypothetical protein